MKKIVLFALAAILCASCIHVNINSRKGLKPIKGEGEVITRSFDLKDFDKIIISGAAEATFVQSSEWEVSLRTHENIFDYLDYYVKGGTLYLEIKDHRPINTREYKLNIKAPDLAGITVNGAAELNIPVGLKHEGDVKLEVNGAGDLDLACISCSNLALTCNGAADVDLQVETESVAVKVNGAGDVNIGGVTVDASFEVNGVGSVDATDLTVSGTVHKHTAGAAAIRLKKQ